jgi:hypothetical protein
MAESYTVISQTPTTMIQPGAGAVPATDITFVTKPSDIPGRVQIPKSIFSVREVDKVVRAEAAILEAVQNL